MIKTKLIKKHMKLEVLSKNHKYRAVKPVFLNDFEFGKKKRVLRLNEEHGAYLKQALDHKPNLTLPELRTMVKRHFLMQRLSVSTVRNHVVRNLGYSCKVLHHSPANAFSEYNKRRRVECAKEILEAVAQGKMLLFCDEYSFSNQRICRYGWALKGKNVYVPTNQSRVSFSCIVTHSFEKVVAFDIVKGTINSDIFIDHLTKVSQNLS